MCIKIFMYNKYHVILIVTIKLKLNYQKQGISQMLSNTIVCFILETLSLP